MTQVSGVPDELHGYTTTTANSAIGLGSTTAVTLGAINAFNDANAGSDVPGTIDDVATPVDRYADVLLDHDRIPAAFAAALVALDADGLADGDGRYTADDRYTAFADSLVHARMADPNGTDAAVFDAALTRFDRGFADTYRRVRAIDPSAGSAAVWDAAVGEQARQDAETLERYAREGFADRKERDEYESMKETLAAVASRSGALGGYAEQLFIDHLGAGGVKDVLDEIGRMRHERDLPIRADLIEPFAAGFAVAAAAPRAAPMIRELAVYDLGDPDLELQLARVGMLLTGADQPTAFVVPAASTLIRMGGGPPMGLFGPPHSLFGDNPGSWPTIGVEALAANPDASAAYVSAERDNANLEYLVYGPHGEGSRLEGGDGQRYQAAAGRVIEHAILTRGTLGTGTDGVHTPTDELLIDVIERSQRNVPDDMKLHLATLTATTPVMARIEDFIAEPGDRLELQTEEYFEELARNDEAMRRLTLGAVVQYNTGVHAGLASLPHLDTVSVNPTDVIQALDGYTHDGRQLLSTLGVAMSDVDSAQEKAHGAMVSAVTWVAKAGTGMVMTASPFGGPPGVALGLGVNGVVDASVSAFSDATDPDSVNAPNYVGAVERSVRDYTGQALFADPATRALLIADSASTADPATISYADFIAIPEVDQVMDSQADDTRQDSVMAMLAKDYFATKK